MERRFPQGATIFAEGAPSGSIYILESGLVRLISLSEKGQETIPHIHIPIWTIPFANYSDSGNRRAALS
jgi:CRP-like cAMP-binding protein